MVNGNNSKAPVRLCKLCGKPYHTNAYLNGNPPTECDKRFELLQQSGIAKGWWWIKAPKLTEGNKTAISEVNNRLENIKRGQGLYLFGDVGIGKTHLASYLGQQLIIKKGLRVIWWDVARLFTTLKMNIGKNHGYYGQDINYGPDNKDNDSIISWAIKSPYLFLDDLGREKSTDWTHEILFHIVNSRYENKNYGIVVASNLNPSQLASKVGEQIVSRLFEMCGEPIKLTGEDWRLKSIHRKT